MTTIETESLFSVGELSLWVLIIVAVGTILVVPAIVIMSTRQTCHREDIALRPKLPVDKRHRGSEKIAPNSMEQTRTSE